MIRIDRDWRDALEESLVPPGAFHLVIKRGGREISRRVSIERNAATKVRVRSKSESWVGEARLHFVHAETGFSICHVELPALRRGDTATVEIPSPWLRVSHS